MNGLVLAVAMLAVVNPAARAHRLRHLDHQRSMLAAAVALAVVVAVAAAAGPVLSAGDVSAPNARVGAGLVVAVAGLLDLVRSGRIEADLPDGPGGAVVPAAFPVLLEPQVAVLALSAGADRGVAVTALAGAGALAVFVAARPVASGAGGRSLVPVGRLIGAVGVLAGTALVVDGVLSV